MNKFTFSLLAVIFTANISFAQPPNDDPNGATALTVGSNFNDQSIISTNVSATNSELTDATIPAPGCGAYNGADVWFSAVVPATGNLTIETKSNTGSSLTDTAIAIYSGAIGAFTLIECDDDDNIDGGFSRIRVTGLTSGQTVYIRAWEYNGGTEDTFQVSVFDGQVPANDEPTNAIGLSLGSNFTDQAVVGSTIFATASQVSDASIPAPGCGSYNGGDVWFSATVPASGNITIETDENSGSTLLDTGIAVYSGAIGAFTLLDCDDSNGNASFSKLRLSARTPGETLYIRVWEGSADIEDTFQISVFDGPTPTNDEPNAALALTTGANFNDQAVIANSTFATASEITDTSIPAPGCGNYNGGDIWYTATVPVSGNMTIETRFNTGSSIFDTGMAVYSGSIGAFSLLQCDDSNGSGSFSKIRLTGLTSGQTLYIRLWEDDGNADDTFQISAFDGPVPTNDEPSNANALIVGADFSAQAVVGTNVFATASEINDNSIPAPGCGSYNGGDVWYTAVVPASGNITLETRSNTGSTITDIDMAIYSGSIGSLTLVECDDFGGIGNFAKMRLFGRTPGEILYIRVWEYIGDQEGAFQISAFDGPVPTNDDPNGAIALAVGSVFNDNSVVGSNLFATASEVADNSIPAPGCAFYNGGDLWYTAVVPASGNLSIEIRSNTSSVLSDTGLAIYSGSIGAFALIECDDFDGLNSFSKIRLIGQTPGETLYIRVWEDGNDIEDTFQISVFDGPTPTNDDPNGAVALTVGAVFSDNNVVGSNLFATASEIADNSIPAPGCAFYNGGDVWYTAVVPASGNVTLETRSSTGSAITDLDMAIYSGNIGAFTLVECDDFNGAGSFAQIELTGRTPGELLYIRVWEYGGDIEDTFQISAHDFVLTNDDPVNATALTVGNTFSATAIVGNTSFATASETTDATIPAPGCGSYNGEDVWYAVVVPASGEVNIETKSEAGSSLDDTAIAIYSGAIGAFSLVECDDDNGDGLFSEINLTNRTPGETLYIRTWVFDADEQGAFQISAWTATLSTTDFSKASFSFYPNPVEDTLFIKTVALVSRVSIYSVQGQEIMHLDANTVDNITNIDTSRLPKGIYMVTLTDSNNITSTFKILKK